jgi:hypothetical protein
MEWLIGYLSPNKCQNAAVEYSKPKRNFAASIHISILLHPLSFWNVVKNLMKLTSRRYTYPYFCGALKIFRRSSRDSSSLSLPTDKLY